jgi:hypothetical protein
LAGTFPLPPLPGTRARRSDQPGTSTNANPTDDDDSSNGKPSEDDNNISNGDHNDSKNEDSNSKTEDDNSEDEDNDGKTEDQDDDKDADDGKDMDGGKDADGDEDADGDKDADDDRKGADDNNNTGTVPSHLPSPLVRRGVATATASITTPSFNPPTSPGRRSTVPTATVGQVSFLLPSTTPDRRSATTTAVVDRGSGSLHSTSPNQLGLASTTTGSLTKDGGKYLYQIFMYCNLKYYNIDVLMSSPPNSPPCLQGSSRTVGGILRGHALGNVFNFADGPDMAQDNLVPSSGKVLVYLSDQNPANLVPGSMKPTARIKATISNTIRPVLEKIARKYSPAQGNYYMYL